MKKIALYLTLIQLCLGCEKNISREDTVINSGNVLKLNLNDAINVTSNSIEVLANFTYLGDGNVLNKGICWSETPNPTISNFVVNKGSGIIEITHKIDTLKSNTTYYLRAFGENINGVFYSNEISFKTELGIQLKTNPATNINLFEADCSAEIMNNDGLVILQRGFCYSDVFTIPTTSAYTRNSQDLTNKFTIKLNGLQNNYSYNIRAYVITDRKVFYGNTISITTKKNKYNIGDLVEGGIVFYVYPDGINGIIAANNNIGSAKWGCEGTYINIADNPALGLGFRNTLQIVQYCTTPNIAASMCNDLVLNGYSDWYLPSQDELFFMYKNLYQKGLANFIVGNYWTSTQYGNYEAYFQYFNSVTIQNKTNKDANSYLIRPVRYY